uniref:Uncharacterized protein n=1 Tax=Triticum urartu TaxID=4572 RepID=A0A8R7RDZ1_TRIUA
MAEAVARAPVPQRRAVCVRARVVHGGWQLSVPILQVLVEHAPLRWQVLHPLDPEQVPVLAIPTEVHGELWLPVVGEESPVALEAPGQHALLVLVNQREQVGVHVTRPQRCPDIFGHLLQKTIVELLCILDVGALVAVCWPADLADYDLHVGHAGLP